METTNSVIIREKKTKRYTKVAKWQSGCSVLVEGYQINNDDTFTYKDKQLAAVTLRNLSNDVICAIKVKIDGWDSFGEMIESKQITMIDLQIEPGTQFGFNSTFEINQMVSNLDVFIVEIAFTSRIKEKVDSLEVIDLGGYVQDFENKESAEYKFLNYLWISMSKGFPMVNGFSRLDNGWICCCGQLNLLTTSECLQCKGHANNASYFRLNNPHILLREMIDKNQSFFIRNLDDLKSKIYRANFSTFTEFEKTYLQLDPLIKNLLDSEVRPFIQEMNDKNLQEYNQSSSIDSSAQTFSLFWFLVLIGAMLFLMVIIGLSI